MSYSINLSGLTKYQKNLKRIQQNKGMFFSLCARELAARLLRKVIKRTPVGVNPTDRGYDISEETYDTYWAGYNGGTLRRGWMAKTEKEAESGGVSDVMAFVDSLNVEKHSNVYQITVTNPVHYASYVEYGHRQRVGRFVPAIERRLKRSWVEGQFMLKISEDELRVQSPAIIQRNIEKWLRQMGV